MDVEIRVIPHDQQRYETVGDWRMDAEARDVTTDVLKISVSKMGKDTYEHLVAHHEYTEALLCLRAGISPGEVDAFDTAYEEARASYDFRAYDADGSAKAPCGCYMSATSEPGDDVHAPYYRQHQVATGFERIMAAELGVSWNAYEAAVLAAGEQA